jgi:prohibitin 2
MRDEDQFSTLGTGAIGTVVVFLLLIVGFLFCTATVPAGHVGIVNNLGQVNDYALQPGFQIKAPWTGIINMSVQTEKYTTSATSASSDLQDVKTEVTLNYRLKPDSTVSMYKNVGVGYADKIIIPAVSESVKASTARFSATDLIQKRPDVKAAIEKTLSERLLTYGLYVESVSITDFQFSESFTKAIEAKVVVAQETEKATNELAKIKIEKEQTITRSEAEAQSVKNAADADAYRIKAKADADAYALEVVRKQLEQNKTLIEYTSIQKWDGKLPTQMLGNSPVPFLDISQVQ